MNEFITDEHYDPKLVMFFAIVVFELAPSIGVYRLFSHERECYCLLSAPEAVTKGNVIVSLLRDYSLVR